ncbi:FUSC family protein [Paraburkholderia fungorum]|uniref:FUSC family protein n=1 Tax=Paraburkholderia fungorum TaxID=134537 RepID=UPI001C1EF98A|nr:FUSC family protein [Paraburkholderia fungorum]MBU7440213.1 FUSC family protein [Paraburkholderia fungorum]
MAKARVDPMLAIRRVVNGRRIATYMFNGLINNRMLLRGAMLLAPVFIMGLITGNPIWFRVQIVTVSVFIAAERSRLAPLGVLLHTLVIGCCFLTMTASLGRPGTFVIASVLLAIACVAITDAGVGMRWTGTFTFIPVLYVACATADGASGYQLGQTGLKVLPYLFCSALPVVFASCASYLWKKLVSKARGDGWHALRQVAEPPAPGCFEGIIAAALAVGVAASLAGWHGIHYAQWLVWSAASVVTGDVGSARTKWRDRMVGAFVGVPAGMLVGIFMPHTPVLFDALTAAMALTLVAFNRYVVAFGARCALHAVAIIVAGHAVFAADCRVIDVAIGSVIGIVFVLGTNRVARSFRGNCPGGARPPQRID